MQTVTLIIDKRREISVKYKKLLENEYSNVIISKDLISAMKFIQDKEPDLIIISDSMGEDLDVYCKDIRAITYNMRPVIVATSKSAELSDKLKVLDAGADDFISEPVNSKEFAGRIQAHLRREFESNLDEKKLLPNRNYSMRSLKRVLSYQGNWAALLISIDNFSVYREAYTKLASDRLVQTYSAIIASALSKEDFLGGLSENEFLVITDELKAEKLANFLIFAFDAVVEKFYSASDIKRGFVITQGETQAGMRSEFVHSTIGIVTSKSSEYKTASELIAALENIHRMAKLPDKSNYLIERTKLEAEDSVLAKSFNNKVLIIEEDEAMTVLLSTILKLQGYEIQTAKNFKLVNFEYKPAVIILDAGKEDTHQGLDVCKIIKESHLYKSSKLIVTSVFRNKETILKAGADLYLPKPYDVSGLVKWVDSFIKEFNY
ncbi:MAG: response regulator [Candidatus Gastranaerophilaceae bacterium]|nr:response regulator [Candidatus Gastranaerophilaceae bacterium]